MDFNGLLTKSIELLAMSNRINNGLLTINIEFWAI